jgi:hypothetical protein
MNMSQDGFITDVGHVFGHKINNLTANTFFFVLGSAEIPDDLATQL